MDAYWSVCDLHGVVHHGIVGGSFGNFSTTVVLSPLIKKYLRTSVERHDNYLGLIKYMGKARRFDITIW